MKNTLSFKNSSTPTPLDRKMSKPSTTMHLPAELWLEIFLSLDDPFHVVRIGRTVSRDFLGYVKKYIQVYFVPLCILVVEYLKCTSMVQYGVFSHYTMDGRVACFNIKTLIVGFLVKNNMTVYKEPPESFKVISCGSLNRTVIQVTSTNVSLTQALDRTVGSRPSTGLTEKQKLAC
jgi:hypothetical protein